MFLLNNWYVAAFSSDLKPLSTLARRICNKPVVLYRSASGRAVALEDRCSHRAMPLSAKGQCEGEAIRCPYHGLLFGPDGKCLQVPSQDSVPDRADIRSYPLVERDAALWIWVGDARRADPELIPRYPIHSDPAYIVNSFMVEFAASWLLVLDNLCDLTHLAFVHTGINGDSEAQFTASLKVKPHGSTGVDLVRHSPNCNPPAFYTVVHKFKGRVDRWHEYTITPNLGIFWTGAADANTGAFEGKRAHGLNIHTYHAITPKTDTTCYYFFSSARNFALDSEEVTRKLMEGAVQTIDVEDRPVIEAQQARILDDPSRSWVDLQADAAGVQLRRIIERMRRAESSAESPAQSSAA